VRGEGVGRGRGSTVATVGGRAGGKEGTAVWWGTLGGGGFDGPVVLGQELSLTFLSTKTSFLWRK